MWVFQNEEILESTAGYYNCIKRLDDGFGLLDKLLEKHGLFENTLVIFLGDHGPPFTRAKTTCYEAGVKIPFILRWPGSPCSWDGTGRIDLYH